jgi:WD40 repeat protein
MLYGHIRYVNCVVYSPNGRYIASGSDDGSVRIWNAITGALEHVFIDKTDQVFSVEYSADGNHIIVCRGLLHSRTVIINAVTGAVECMFPDAKLAACSPDGKHMVIVHSDNVSHRCPVRIWNIERAVFEATLFNTNTRHINAMVYSPDGVHVAFGIDSAVQIWNVETGLRDHVLIGHTNDVIALAYSPDGQHLISCGGHTICIWNTQTGELENLLPERFNGASCAAYSPDGSAVATGDFNGVLYLWGVGADLRKLGATASKLHVLACHARVPCEGQEQASVIARKVIDSYAETLNAMIMQEVDWRAVQQFYLEYQKELSDDVLLRDSVSAYIQERCTGASSSGSYSSSHDSK